MNAYDGRIDSRALEHRLAELRKPVTMTEHAARYAAEVLPGSWTGTPLVLQGFEAGWRAAIRCAIEAMEAEQDKALGR